MEEASSKNFPGLDLFDLDAGASGYAWTSPLSVDLCFWSSGKMEPMWITAVFSPCGGVRPTLLSAELLLLLNLNFICGKSLAANASLQTTLSNSCFSKYFGLDLLSSFLLFYKLYTRRPTTLHGSSIPSLCT